MLFSHNTMWLHWLLLINNKRELFDVAVKSFTYEGRFYVRRKVDLMKTAKVNAYVMHIFEKIELLSIHAT